MADLIPVAITKAGLADLDASLAAADVAGDNVPVSSGIFIVVKNADASPHTLTIAKPATSAICGNLGSVDLDDMTLIVAAADTGFISVPRGYAQNGLISWTYDGITSVTVGVFSIAP